MSEFGQRLATEQSSARQISYRGNSMMHSSRLTLFVCLVATGVFLGMSDVPCLAQDASPVIHACIHKSSGLTRIVDTPADCRPSEKPVSWNQAGPKGDPGLPGPQGEKGDAGPAGPQGLAGKSTHAYAPGAISSLTLNTCREQAAESCNPTTRVAVTLPEHASHRFRLSSTALWMGHDGQEQSLDRLLELTMSRPPRSGSPCAPNAVEVGVTQTDLGWGTHTFRFCLTPDVPLYNVKQDLTVPGVTRDVVDLTASYIPDWLIVFDLEPGTVSDIVPLTQGTVVGFVDYVNDQGEPDSINGHPQLAATVMNVGDFGVNYVVTASDLGPADACLEPIEPRTRFLLPGESHTWKTVLRPCEGTRLPSTCKLTLRLFSPDGNVYDAVDVIWDNPEPREP